MKTRVSTLLGTQRPLVQGGMARIAEAHLAASVSEAGGLGVIAAGGARIEWLEEQIDWARSLTSKPLGVNIMMMDPRVSELASLVAEKRIEVVTTGAGSPSEYIDMWKEAGCKVVPVVASVAHAVRMERCGADALIAEGCEAGGHIGEMTTMALIPQVCDSVSIPVIAAGGIADGRGLCAAFALGAEGVQLGTAFLTTDECMVAEAYKERILKAKDSDTIVTGRSFGRPIRALKNPYSRSLRKIEAQAETSADEFEELSLGALRKAVEGDVDEGSFMAGQIAGLIHRKLSARELIEGLFAEAESMVGLSLSDLAERNAGSLQSDTRNA